MAFSMSRPVKIMCVALKPLGEAQLLSALDAAAYDGLDLVALPETCVVNQAEGYTIDSDFIRSVRDIAKTYDTNVILPVYLAYENAKRVNAAVVIDRRGDIKAVYRKLYPYWSEFDLSPPCAVTDGGDCVADLDFGRIGLAICFDSNFPGVWQNLSDKGAELTVWCSAYSAGSQLSAYSLTHHYPIVTCTQVPDSAVFDIDGREIKYGKGEGGAYILEHTVDLDRCIFHYNFNRDKAEKLLAEHRADIEIEKDYWREQWFILRSKSEKASARELAARYNMKELKAYKSDSMAAIDAMRIDVR